MLGLLANSSNSSDENASSSTFFLQHYKIPKTIAYCLLFLISIVGNSLIVWIINKDNRLRNTTNFLVANMAVSDLLSTVVNVPWRIVEINFDFRWLIPNSFGLALCKLVPFVQSISITVSMYSCVFIAIDRYYAVAYPLRGGFTRSRLKCIIPGIWIFAALIASPFLYSHGLIRFNEFEFCTVLKDNFPLYVLHVYILIGIIVFLPLCFISTLYILIVYNLRHHRPPGNQTDLARRRRDQQNRKVLKLSVAIISLLYVSWLFSSIYIILWYQGHFNSLTYMHFVIIYFVAQFIAYMSFAYNVFIYIIFNDIYRENVKALITKWCCRLSGHGSVNCNVVGSVGQNLELKEIPQAI